VKKLNMNPLVVRSLVTHLQVAFKKKHLLVINRYAELILNNNNNRKLCFSVHIHNKNCWNLRNKHR